MINRRSLLEVAVAGSVLVAAQTVRAQLPGKVYRLGWLGLIDPGLQHPLRLAFYDELRRRGYVEGRNLALERRYAAGQPERLPALAGELARS